MEAIAPITSPSPVLTGRRRMPRRALLLIALGGIAAGVWIGGAKLRSKPGAPSLVQEPVQRGDVAATVTATGTLSPVVQVQVGSQVSGRVKQVLVDWNSEVKAGQVIARIDPELLDSAIAQAKARLTSAQANLSRTKAVAQNARVQHERLAELGVSGAVSRSEVDTALADQRSAEAQVTAARAEVTLAQAALEQAQVNLTYTTIRSPIDGVVVTRSVDVGQTVAASLSAPILFVIAGDLRQMEVHASVAESDVGQIAPDMRVEFSVDAFPDETFAGKVKQVRYEAQSVSNVVTYDAVIAVENDQLKLRPGMTANVTFVVGENKDVLLVANKALRYRPASAPVRGAGGPGQGRGGRRQRGDAQAAQERQPGKRGMVWVMRSGEPTPVRIRTGLSDGKNTAVLAGELEEGDQVIISDAATAKASAGASPTPGGNPSGRGGRGGRRGPPSVL